MQTSEYQTIHVDYPEPHLARTKEIIKAHPEVRSLFGTNPWSALCILFVLGSQIFLASYTTHLGLWPMIAIAWILGAVFNHAMFVLIHDATHNLIFTKSSANKWWAMIANLPVVFPTAIGFRTFHLVHHRYQGEMDKDADLAGPIETKIVGNAWWRKCLWFLGFFYFYGIVRPARLKKIKYINDPWLILNVMMQISFVATMVYFFGWSSIGYLVLSSFFSVGLHPLGARWIQEHFVLHPNQETYSYYGSFNLLMFNVGYHNEHHDLMMVPWNKLPTLKKMAPEFYDNLISHTSYWKLLAKFIFDPKLSLASRVTRDSRALSSSSLG